MQKLKEYKEIIIIVLVLIVGAFYWFQLRPTNIRKECYKDTYIDATDKISELDKKYGIYDERNERDYEKCLKSKGL